MDASYIDATVEKVKTILRVNYQNLNPAQIKMILQALNALKSVPKSIIENWTDRRQGVLFTDTYANSAHMKTMNALHVHEREMFKKHRIRLESVKRCRSLP